MPTNIKYSDIIMYLEAIAGNANKDPGNCVHHYWWHVSPHRANSGPLSYKDFTTGTVVGFSVPIIYQPTPSQSLFYLLLSTPGGSGGYPQMPKDGPYITDAGYSVQLSNSTTITGAQIQANIKEWLGNGYPE